MIDGLSIATVSMLVANIGLMATLYYKLGKIEGKLDKVYQSCPFYIKQIKNKVKIL